MAAKLSIEEREERGRCTLVLEGELDLASVQALERAVAAACARTPGELLLDLRAVSFIDSTGLRAIFDTQASCARAGWHFGVLAGEDPAQRRLFEIAGVLDVLPLRREP